MYTRIHIVPLIVVLICAYVFVVLILGAISQDESIHINELQEAALYGYIVGRAEAQSNVGAGDGLACMLDTAQGWNAETCAIEFADNIGLPNGEQLDEPFKPGKWLQHYLKTGNISAVIEYLMYGIIG